MSKTLQLLTALCLILFSGSSVNAWWNPDWAIRKSITIDGASKEVPINGPISDTVVLLRLHDGNFHFSSAAEDGSDLRIVAADDQTLLPFHIEKYDSLFSEAFVWVRVPEVKPGEQTTLWLYYGHKKGGAERVENAKETYAGKRDLVYHFNEQGSAPSDASGNDNTAENAGLSTTGAIIGGGLRLPGNVSVKIPASPSMEWPAGTSLTWSAWVKAGAAQPNSILFSRSDEGKAFVVGVDSGTPYVEVRADGSQKRGQSTSPLTEGTWHHLALVANGDKISFYLDGEPAGEVDAVVPALNSPSVIGARETGDEAAGFVGELDELQIARQALSVDAIRFSAVTQGGERAAGLLALGDDEAPKGALDLMDGGFMGTIMKNLTFDGWVVIVICAFMLVISWWIMYDKTRYVNRIAKANALFIDEWQHVVGDFSVLENGDEAHAGKLGGRVTDAKHRGMRYSSVYRIYRIGLKEVRTRVARDKEAGVTTGLTGRSMAAIRASLEGGFVREMQKLNSSMVILTIAISGGPFLGLLGTVIGVMITFAAVAEAGDVNVNAIAPGIAAALAATVAGLAVAIPALFGYNYLLARVKEASADMQIFIDEFVTKAGEFYDNAKS